MKNKEELLLVTDKYRVQRTKQLCYYYSQYNITPKKKRNVGWKYYSTLTSKNLNKEEKFNQYLAGVIDGDGSLLLSKQGYGSLEITMDSRDERCLAYIKKKLSGGTLKARSNSRSIRYRLMKTAAMVDLVHRINGKIRYPQRINQLKKLCSHYGIEYKPCPKLEEVNLATAYFSGVLDTDGTITCVMKKPKHARVYRPQLTISVTSKNREDLDIWVHFFGGSVYTDKGSKNPTYKWTIQSKEAVMKFVEYVSENPLQTMKQNRILAIPEYYRLYELHSFKPENKVLYKKFKSWLEEFSSFGYSRDANISTDASEVK